MHPDLHTDLDNLIAMQNLRHSAKGSNDAYDVTFSLTGYEPNDTVSNELVDFQGPFSNVAPSSDQDTDDTTLGKLLTPRTSRLPQSGRCVCQSVVIVCRVRIERGNPWERATSISLVLVSETRTVLPISFLQSPKLKKWSIERGNPWGESSSSAQIRTLFDEQRHMIIAECCEKISHHELQAAHAEEERRLLQGQLWQQKLEFREAHQRSLTEMEELRKFQSSAFDTMARRKFIEDQNTILELGQRVQELQSEVNCMNHSKDFQDAESVRSGNSHVTSQPMLFPKHPAFEGLLRPSFVSPRRKEGPPNIWDTSGISGNDFANPEASSSAPYPQELKLSLEENY